MDEDAEVVPGLGGAGGEQHQQQQLQQHQPEATEASPKRKNKRGRPSKKKTIKSSSSTKSNKKATAKAKPEAKGAAKAKAQCMGCGKIFARSEMANLRYCIDDKKVTDRLYHAAKAQEQTEWLSDQLSTLEGSIKICNCFKTRFPDWKTKKTSVNRFVTQYREMIQVDDHVHFQNKYSRLKQLVSAEKARSKVSDAEKDAMLNRVMSEHNNFAADDMDLLAMAQSMATGAGKSATAFDNNLMRMGDFLEAMQKEPSEPEASPQKGKSQASVEDQEEAAEDEADGGKEDKWLDVDREITKNVRSMNAWVADAQSKCEKAWKTLVEAEEEARKQNVAAEVSHDLEVVLAKRKALGLVLGYDLDAAVDANLKDPPKLSEELALKRIDAYIGECKGRAALPRASPTKEKENPENPMVPGPTASAASAAGDRAKLGQAPPCKSYVDLTTLMNVTALTQRFMQCATREEFKQVSEDFKPIKKAVQELVGLCNATAKDSKGAITAAVKRRQQAEAGASKKRKVAAAGGAGDGGKQSNVFQFIKDGDKVSQVIVGKLADAGVNDLNKPFMVNIPNDFENWAGVLPDVQKTLGDFRLEFDASPLRVSVGRAQKPLGKIAADANLEMKVMRSIFHKVFPEAKMHERGAFTDDALAMLLLQCFGLAKNTCTCVPEKGHLPTASFTLEGSASLVLVPLEAFLIHMGDQAGLGEAAQKLK
ncbi:unnamed protein product, partial [Symbiodinium sp. KB8]